jgi:S-methylmethionine-dependent homocysteine/selenocysteine methylase
MTLLLLDGPVGTELAARGYRTELPLWSAGAIERAPEVLASIHRDYASAGATVHTANTFRTKARQAGDRWRALATRAVEIARASVPAEHRVAGSIAPLEDCYRPDLSPSDPEPEHRELARALADAGVDLVLCETFPHPGEALAASRAALSTGLPVWLALTAGPNADLMSPATMRETARAAVDLGVAAVLVNCVPVLETLRFIEAIADLGVPFGAYANAGAADDEIGWRSDPDPRGVERYATEARRWIDTGATLVGSCCGTAPAHIRTLAEALSGFVSPPAEGGAMLPRR